MGRLLVAFALLSVVAVAGRTVQAQVPNHVVMAGYQYAGGGSADVPFVTSAGLHSAGLGTPVLRGDPITFTNADPISVLALHTASSCDAPCADGLPNGLFTTGLLDLGASYTLSTASLAPGTYVYYCEVHGQSMRGSFTIL